jgi:C-methyltransferase
MKDELKTLFTSHWKYLAIFTACKVKLFDKIASGKSVFDLIVTQKWCKISTEAILDVCKQEDLLLVENGTINLTAKGKLLVSTHPDNMHYACLHWGNEHLNSWQNLDFTIQTGQSSFERIYGEPFFDYIGKRPEKLNDYHKAMYAYAMDDYKDLAHVLEIPQNQSVIDIGGGYGALIHSLKLSRPDLECALFDLPEVIQNVHLNSITRHSGNFFESIPKDYDHYILSRVIHDWDDSNALLILENVMKLLEKGNSIYIIENLTDKIKNKASLLSLNMKAICESYERTTDQYLSLLAKFDLNIKISQLNEYQYIIRGIKQ